MPRNILQSRNGPDNKGLSSQEDMSLAFQNDGKGNMKAHLLSDCHSVICSVICDFDQQGMSKIVLLVVILTKLEYE